MGIYELKVKNGKGEDFDLASLKGQVTLVVNTATGCAIRALKSWISLATSSVIRHRAQTMKSISSALQNTIQSSIRWQRLM